MDQDAAKAGRALALYDLATKAAPAESVYGKRIALIGKYLERLRVRLTMLSQKRGPVPSVRKVGGEPMAPIVVGRQTRRSSLAKNPHFFHREI